MTNTVKTPRRNKAAQAANLVNVRVDSMNHGTSRTKLLASVFRATGPTPVAELLKAVMVEIRVGYMAASVRRSTLRVEPKARDLYQRRLAAMDDETLMANCRDRLDNYQSPGTELQKGKKGFRTEAEESAYGSTRTFISVLLKDAGIVNPNGGKKKNSSKSRKPRAGKAKAAATAKPARAAPAVKAYRTQADLLAFVTAAATVIRSNVNRNAKIAPLALMPAVETFLAELKKIGE